MGPVTPERAWRRLALAAAAACGALAAGRRPARNWLGETPDGELRRRLAACEAHLQDLEERLNARGTQHR